MAKIHMILQGKGGVGKSLIAARNKISKPRQAAIINLFATAISMCSIAVFLLIKYSCMNDREQRVQMI